MFLQCRSITHITIPDGVQSIGKLMFYNCSSLSEIDIPESVQEFAVSSFADSLWLEGKRAENPYVVVNNILVDAKMVSGDAVEGNLLLHQADGMGGIFPMALHVPVIYNIARLQNAQGIEFLLMVYGIGSHGVEYLWVFIGIDLGIRKPEHGKRRGRRRRTGAGALGGRSGQARICRGDRRAFRSGQRKLHTGIIRGKGTADPFLFFQGRLPAALGQQKQ